MLSAQGVCFSRQRVIIRQPGTLFVMFYVYECASRVARFARRY